MCVLEDCADPTGKGVWWRDDTKWCLYNPVQQLQIREGIASGLPSVDLGVITSIFHPHGAPYVVNLVRMDQKNARTGQRRPIMILDEVKPSQQGDKPMQGLPTVYYRDPGSDRLRQYSIETSYALLRAVRHALQKLVVRDSQSGRLFLFDLKSMYQYVAYETSGDDAIINNKYPAVEVVMDWSNDWMISIAIQPCSSMMRRNVLAMVFEKYIRDEEMDRILRGRAFPWAIKSKTLKSTSHGARFHNFVDTLDSVFENYDQQMFGKYIREATENGKWGQVQLAFKPEVRRSRTVSRRSKPQISPGLATREIMNKINGEGTRNEVYCFDLIDLVTAAKELNYGRDQLRILVFLVILPLTSCVYEKLRFFENNYLSRLENSEYIRVEKPELLNSVHLCEVTVN